MAIADDVLSLFEQRHGIFLKKSFYDSWYQTHSQTAPRHPEGLYTEFFKHFLNLDMATCTEPFLQKKGIQNKMVLQLQHTIDTSSSLYHLIEALDKNGPISRGNLKWILTDGDRDIITFELNKIPTMNLKTPFGSKVQITSAVYASGILLVKPENFQLLGGQVSELYGDTMENELLRRYTRQLQLQTNTGPERTTRVAPVTRVTPTTQVAPTTPNATPLYQNNTGSTSRTTTTAAVSNWTSSNNNTNPIPQAVSITFPQQSNLSTSTSEAIVGDHSDDFDYWPVDDFDELEEIEQQATITPTPATPVTPATASNFNDTSNNLQPQQCSRGSNQFIVLDDEFSQRPAPSIDDSYTHADTSTASTPKRRSKVSLSTKSKHNGKTKSPNISTPSTARPSISPPAYIDLDNTPSPPSSPSKNLPIQQVIIHNSNDTMVEDSQWPKDDTQGIDNGNDMDSTKGPGILSIAELRTLLKAIDNNSFNGDFDRVSVQIQGCQIKNMKPKNDRLHLRASLLENYTKEKPLIVNFQYLGINSLFEGYTLDEISEIKSKQGVDAVKKKVFTPLQSTLKKTAAVLEVDLTTTELYQNTVLLTCTKFTPMCPL